MPLACLVWCLREGWTHTTRIRNINSSGTGAYRLRGAGEGQELDGVSSGSSKGGRRCARPDARGGRRGPNFLPQLLPLLRLQGQGKQQSCAEASVLWTPCLLYVSTSTYLYIIALIALHITSPHYVIVVSYAISTKVFPSLLLGFS